MNIKKQSFKYTRSLISQLMFIFLASSPFYTAYAEKNIAQVPLFLTSSVPGAVMINMSVDSQLFFSAFPETADLIGDGEPPDRGYIHAVDYFGYFDPYKCYEYSTTNNRFEPVSISTDKYCTEGNWSGNFLNWTTMSRIDTVRKILYGGMRQIDTPELTVLERSYLPNDAHSWVKYYDGYDLDKLTPFTAPPETITSSDSSFHVLSGSRRGSGDRLVGVATPGWSSNDAFPGDQVKITHSAHHNLWMKGVILNTSLTTSNPSDRKVDIQITGSKNPSNITESLSGWQIINKSRKGISFCNTTIASGASHENDAINAPPKLKVALGDYSLWAANERWQCRWRESIGNNNLPPDRMAIGQGDFQKRFSNGNDVVSSELWANSDMPRRGDVRPPSLTSDLNVRVSVCVEGLIGTENCREYGPDSLKPVGLLQDFGESDELRFGLMTGSFTNHISGGVLRKNLSSFNDEVDSTTGEFLLPTDSIIRTLDALRIFGYSHGSGEYTVGPGSTRCPFGTTKSGFLGGRCISWGNPQAEIFAESLRYFATDSAGERLSPNSNFTHTGNDRLPGLTSADWNNPITEAEWCTPKNIIQFNASVTSFDDDAPSAASDLPSIGDLNTWTNLVGSGENLAGASVFAGGSSGFCSPENINNLADFIGICPEAPNQDGTYHIAGLAHYAYTTDLNPTWTGTQNIRTYGVSLAPAVPRIEIPLPGKTEPAVIILPACDNRGDDLRCALADFRIVSQDIENGTGSFFIQWDVSEWGADFDMDINGTLSYEITNNEITVTTQTWADSSGRETGFGYIISGTNNDGFHAHSGINNYQRINSGNVPNCPNNGVNCNVGAPPTSATFSVGGSTAELLREPLFYAAKWGGYDKSLNFPNNVDSWDSKGRGLPDNYFFAINPAELLTSLEEVFESILAESSASATALASSSIFLTDSSLIFQTSFDSDDWSGDLAGFRPSLDENGQLVNQRIWTASDEMPASSNRNIFTHNGTGNGIDKGALFSWDTNGLTSAQKLLLDNDEDILNFIRGENIAGMRQRTTPIGDIINSDPVFTHREGFGYQTMGSQVNEASSYNQFVLNKGSRPSMVYVGSNAGMLHAFDALTGVEKFAYVPSSIIKNLPELTEVEYEHRYFVDGKIHISDAYIDGQWRTILIGTTGAGGRSVFALDISNPASFSADDVLWEFTHPELGKTIGNPVIGRLKNGKWSVFLGNGYNSDSLQSQLFIIDLETGDLTRNISTNMGSTSSPNGLSSPAMYYSREDGNSFIATVYAGDLHGNLWKFDLNSTTPADWGIANSGDALFTAVHDGSAQPITVRPELKRHPAGGMMVLFGTGSYFRVEDPLDNSLQTIYGIRDIGSVVDKNNLVEQEIIFRGNSFNREVTAISNKTVDYLMDDGWYLNLVYDENFQGERLVTNPQMWFERLRLSTIIPSEDPCVPGSSSWNMEINYLTGGRLNYSVFDLDGDGVFDLNDGIMVDGELIPVSGIGTDQSGAALPATMGDQIILNPNVGDGSLGYDSRIQAPSGRQSWREVR